MMMNKSFPFQGKKQKCIFYSWKGKEKEGDSLVFAVPRMVPGALGTIVRLPTTAPIETVALCQGDKVCTLLVR